MEIPQATKKHRRSVYNWVNGNKPVVRSESQCLVGIVDDEDYIALNTDETDRAGLEGLFDRVVQSWPRLARAVWTPYYSITEDEAKKPLDIPRQGKLFHSSL